jgi:hypothetical protein
MAEEEKEKAEAGMSPLHNVNASTFLLLGIQNIQCVLSSLFYYLKLIYIRSFRQTLRTEARGERRQTLLQKTTLVERRTVLLKRIQRFREIQRIHMPGFDAKSHANALQTKSCDDTVPAHVEDSQLFLPSELSSRNRRKYCAAGLADLEDHL